MGLDQEMLVDQSSFIQALHTRTGVSQPRDGTALCLGEHG